MGESLTKRSNSLCDQKGEQRSQPRNKPQSQEAGTLPSKVHRKIPHRAGTGARDASLTDKIVMISLNKCRAARGALELRGVSGRPAAHHPGDEEVGSRGKVTKGLQGARPSLPAPRPAIRSQMGAEKVTWVGSGWR